MLAAVAGSQRLRYDAYRCRGGCHAGKYTHLAAFGRYGNLHWRALRARLAARSGIDR